MNIDYDYLIKLSLDVLGIEPIRIEPYFKTIYSPNITGTLEDGLFPDTRCVIFADVTVNDNNNTDSIYYVTTKLNIGQETDLLDTSDSVNNKYEGFKRRAFFNGLYVVDFLGTVSIYISGYQLYFNRPLISYPEGVNKTL